MTMDLDRWDPLSPAEVSDLLAPLQCPWWIAGGWAIDLFLGRQTRQHADTDVVLLRRDQLEAHGVLVSWQLFKADPPGQLQARPEDEFLPVGVHDIWCRPHEHAPWTFQFMVSDASADQWIFRRTAQIHGPLSTFGYVTQDGIPYLAPEIQLLYKARGLRPKDEADFARTLPALDEKRRHWLAQSLALVHPGHVWLKQLT